MHDTSKGCILWFCLILFFSADLVEWKCCISSLLAWLCVGENPGGRSLAAEPESPEAEFHPQSARFTVELAPWNLGNFGFHFHASRWLFSGGEVFIVYFFYWKMTHDSVIQQQLFAFCLQPFKAWSQQRIHEKNSMAWWKLQGKLRKGRRTSRKRWEVFQQKTQTHPSIFDILPCLLWHFHSICFDDGQIPIDISIWEAGRGWACWRFEWLLPRPISP